MYMQKIKNLKILETPESIEKQWKHALSYRNMLLEKTDWTQTGNSGLTPECVAKFRDWRERLRSINARNGVPFDAVVQATKTVSNFMPELEWDSIKYKDPLERYKAMYIKDIQTLAGSLSAEFTFDIKLLDNNIEGMIAFDRGLKDKESIEHLVIKYGSTSEAAKELASMKRSVIQIVSDVVECKKNSTLLIKQAEDDTICNDIFKAYCEKIDGYRYRLLEVFNS